MLYCVLIEIKYSSKTPFCLTGGRFSLGPCWGPFASPESNKILKCLQKQERGLQSPAQHRFCTALVNWAHRIARKEQIHCFCGRWGPGGLCPGEPQCPHPSWGPAGGTLPPTFDLFLLWRNLLSVFFLTEFPQVGKTAARKTGCLPAAWTSQLLRASLYREAGHAHEVGTGKRQSPKHKWINISTNGLRSRVLLISSKRFWAWLSAHTDDQV